MTRVVCEGVSKVLGGHRALVGISATFEAGKTTVIEGPNGAGKTTLLGLVGGFSRPTSGRVRWLRKGTEQMTREAVRGEVGWLGHDSMLYGDLTGRENLRLAAELFARPPLAGAELERFALGAFLDRPVRLCSRGQRQRVALARALLHGPAIVLLDEPSTGLDKESVERLTRVIREEAERGAVILCVTHDEGFADAIGGGRLRLERGRVREVGPD